jgi:hypothetical protein
LNYHRGFILSILSTVTNLPLMGVFPILCIAQSRAVSCQ